MSEFSAGMSAPGSDSLVNLHLDAARMLRTNELGGRQVRAHPLLSRALELTVRSRVLARSEDLKTVYQDRMLTCRDCGDEFVFSAGEQSFFATKGLQNDPQRCLTCRAAAKRARTAGGPREYHAAVCAMCGGQAMVPFAPRNDRPVYCSSCFDKVRAEPVASA